MNEMKRYTALFFCLLALGTFAQSQAPDIRRFEPRTGSPGTFVQIFGKNFKNATKVRFGSVLAAAFTVINDSTIKAVVGTGASGVIQVNNPFGEDTLGYFTFTQQATPPPPAQNCDYIRNFKPVINDNKNDLVCFRDSVIKLRVSNGEFRSYRWSNGDTTPYTYVRGNQQVSVSVGNAGLGCFSKTTTVKFVRSTSPNPELVYKDSVLRVRPPASFHRWYFNGQPAGTDSMLRASRIGVYRVETSNDKACWTSSREFKVSIGSLVRPGDSLFMKLYPNPSNGPFTVAIVLPAVRTVKIVITITDASGSVVYKSPKLTMTGRELQIPLRISQKGMYRVKAEVNDKVITKVLFIQ